MALVTLVSVQENRRNTSSNKSGTSTPRSAASAPTPPPPSTAAPISAPRDPAEILKNAKNYLARKFDPKSAILSDLSQTRSNLVQIQSTDTEYAEAQKLIAEVNRREDEVNTYTKSYARQVFAGTLEETYLKKSMDVEMSVSGKNNTTLKFKYVLISRPLVYQLQNDSEFMGNLRRLGFTKVIFTDGYNHTWTIDVN